jgi:hypothetical protein
MPNFSPESPGLPYVRSGMTLRAGLAAMVQMEMRTLFPFFGARTAQTDASALPCGIWSWQRSATCIQKNKVAWVKNTASRGVWRF